MAKVDHIRLIFILIDMNMQVLYQILCVYKYTCCIVLFQFGTILYRIVVQIDAYYNCVISTTTTINHYHYI